MAKVRGNIVPLADLASLIEQRSPADSTRQFARVRAAIASLGGKRSNVLTTIQLGTTEAARRVNSYRELTLVDETVPRAKIVDQLRANHQASHLTIADLDVLITPTGNWQLEGSGNDFTDAVPSLAIELFPQENQPQAEWDAHLVHHGLRPFQSIIDATQAWIPLRRFQGRSDGRCGHILIAAPLPGPRFGTILLDQSGLSVEIIDHAKAEGGELKAIWQDGPKHRGESYAITPRIRIPEIVTTESLHLWLIDQTSSVLDHFSENKYGCTRLASVIYGSVGGGTRESEILETIRRGESDTIEFKSYLDLYDNRKSDEVVRTAIALSNTKGGSIFIGVGDRQEILGIENELIRSHAKRVKSSAASTDELGDRYCSEWRKLLSDRVSPHIRSSVDKLRVAGAVIVRINVVEGNEKLYSDSRSQEMWVRRGANTVRPSDAEIKAMLQGIGTLRRLGIPR